MAKEIATADDLQYQFNPVASGSIQFKVRTANDAHIALTSGPEESDPMYEVFIGGWSNTKSVIRKNRTKPDVAEVETPDILNGGEFRGFWIKWDNGTITVGKEGEEEPFLSHSDPDLFGIGYYGICTGWGASGTWLIEGGPREISTIDGGDCLSYNFYPIRHGYLDFEVRTPHNAHISLTTGPKETDPMYEIILGGWENTQSVIRYRREKPDKVQVETRDLTSQGEFRRFIVQWHEGHISVTHKGNVILEWTDPTPIGISYYGVRTAWGASGHWRILQIDSRRITRATTQPGWNVGGGAVCWEKRANGELADGAVPGGVDPESGEVLYVARAEHEGAIIPGKFVPSHGVTYIAWGGAEHGKPEYEILCGCQPTWVKAQDGEIPPGAIEAGKSEDGEVLYVGRVDDGEKLVLGKVQASHKVCYAPYGGAELAYPEYEVLVAN